VSGHGQLHRIALSSVQPPCAVCWPAAAGRSGLPARFTGSSREHTESDLRCYLLWCAEPVLDPLTARRPHLELYIRWMQEIRRFKPSTVSRRFSVAAGFDTTCVIDGILEHSPAEHVRRPSVPAESPMRGFTHLQFEALLTAARQSSNPSGFALVAMLGLLGLRIFEATTRQVAASAKSTAAGCYGFVARAPRWSWSRCRRPSAVGRAIDHAIGTRSSGPILLNSRGVRMDRHAAARRLRRLAETAGIRIARAHPYMPCPHPGCASRLEGSARKADGCPGRRPATVTSSRGSSVAASALQVDSGCARAAPGHLGQPGWLRSRRPATRAAYSPCRTPSDPTQEPAALPGRLTRQVNPASSRRCDGDRGDAQRRVGGRLHRRR
jgi:integrase/recombinase XerD